MDSPLRQFGKRVDDAIYRAAVELGGGSHTGYARLAHKYEGLGWWTEAAEAWKRACALEPRSGIYQAHLAEMRIRLNDLEGALQAATLAVEREPASAFAHYLL